MKTYLTLLFAFLLLCTGAGAALASTPDGQTPAEETVCDSETGAAYGLCNAYCEAMDCESDNPSASATACTRVRDKFEQITGRDLPCETTVVTCPCADPAVSASFAGVVAGTIFFDTCFPINPGIALFDFGLSVAGSNLSICGDGSIFNEVPVSPEEGQACIDLLLQAAAARGVTCN